MKILQLEHIGQTLIFLNQEGYTTSNYMPYDYLSWKKRPKSNQLVVIEAD